ncbi:MAG: alpha/beta hydrolase, partial [Verrucomicrobiota bacterium]
PPAAPAGSAASPGYWLIHSSRARINPVNRNRSMHWTIKLPLILVCLYGLGLLLVFLAQDRLIFFPRRHPGLSEEDKVRRFEYTSTSGEQVAYLIGETGSPEKVWLIFGGNGSLAIDFAGLARSVITQSPETCCVLIDYPGYGANQGKPGRRAIREASDALWAALPGELGLSEDELAARASLLGHSLGAAVAFESASVWEVPRVFAVSPFTSMQDMARRQVTSAFAVGLRHRWDNRRAIERIAEMDDVEIEIFHGEEDGLIPAAMGRELRDLAPHKIQFTPVPSAGHNDVICAILPDLIDLLAGGKNP